MGTGKATEVRSKLKRWRGTWCGQGRIRVAAQEARMLSPCDEGGDGMMLCSEGQHLISGARGGEKGITSVLGSWGHRSRMIWGERRSEGQGKTHLRCEWDETEETERWSLAISLWKPAGGSWKYSGLERRQQ